HTKKFIILSLSLLLRLLRATIPRGRAPTGWLRLSPSASTLSLPPPTSTRVPLLPDRAEKRPPSASHPERTRAWRGRRNRTLH
ncbi:hypothetical protein Taro_051435, partial [Colocasia esculenta]|nr:hypothetical protein [Colocasia esculenta]